MKRLGKQRHIDATPMMLIPEFVTSKQIVEKNSFLFYNKKQ